ncbi:hypothetical protein RclHR1_06810001 [Rhizophagus clarus]|nr:hypothetical protein RclHR1_06810001 [Rhizophagus clarus]
MKKNNIRTELIYEEIIDVHLNVHINASRENIRLNNIHEWLDKFLYFGQVITNDVIHPINKFINIKQAKHNIINKNLSYCKLCKKSIIQRDNQIKFKLCGDCYLINTGWIKSSLTEKYIQIIYLPWWDAHSQCMICALDLTFLSDCQKLCPCCYLIYIGCRYCLTTNIIFGIANQSQCRKCNKTSTIAISIDFNNINSENITIDKFLISTRLNNKNSLQIENYMKNINDDYNPLDIYNFITNNLKNTQVMRWIPYCQITNFEKIAEGGFGIVYKATLLDGGKYQYDDFLSIRNKNKLVAIKKFLNTQDIINYFLNELNSLHQCYNDRIIKYFGITKEPKTKEYMLVMNYASGGDLHNYLKKNFTNITWDKKLYILWQIAEGLKSIHENGFIHRDFHSGNILCEIETIGKWQIGDLGLSQPANNTSLNNEIYGVIPYIAPEIFTGATFSKKSDIYSFGIIMWELTTGYKPFANVEHDINLIYKIIDGKRPKITTDTPECFIELMKECWDYNPLKRPTIEEICEKFYFWSFGSFKEDNTSNQFKQAEEIRLKLIESKNLGSELNENFHLKAVYTSRALSPLISLIKSSLIKPLSKSVTFQPEYITKEYLLDINYIQSKSSGTLNSLRKRNIEETTPEIYCNEKRIKTDINLNSEPNE